MKNYTNDYPLGIGEKWHAVNVGAWWHPHWSIHESELLIWCESMPDEWGRFSWERPMHKFLFETEEAAMWFAMRWSS